MRRGGLSLEIEAALIRVVVDVSWLKSKIN